MVFIVSDQRIATENFEKGKIYKVVFLDESIFYGVCLGIGSNFVMLSGNISGYLFPLTMETASQVESIDLYTPVEPEPPVPPMTNLLQYQTGLPPFTFNTTAADLFSWYIKGNLQQAIGNQTNNLLNLNLFAIKYEGKITFTNGIFDVSVSNQDMYTNGISVNIPANTTFSCENVTKENQSLRGRIKFVFDDNTIQDVLITLSDGTTAQNPVVSFSKAIIAIRLDWSTFNSGFTFKLAMLNSGSTALPYEPFGFKIPILCNENLTNIYLDAPLEEGEILYSTDVNTAIITDIGDNTLSVLTEAQPSEMQIVYKIADR